MSTPTMATITRALAHLHTTHPNAPDTRWEIYPALVTGDIEAHLYGDLTVLPLADIPAAMNQWAEILGVELGIEDRGALATVRVATTLPGGVRLILNEQIPSSNAPGQPQDAATTAPGLF